MKPKTERRRQDRHMLGDKSIASSKKIFMKPTCQSQSSFRKMIYDGYSKEGLAIEVPFSGTRWWINLEPIYETAADSDLSTQRSFCVSPKWLTSRSLCKEWLTNRTAGRWRLLDVRPRIRFMRSTMSELGLYIKTFPHYIFFFILNLFSFLFLGQKLCWYS